MSKTPKKKTSSSGGIAENNNNHDAASSSSKRGGNNVVIVEGVTSLMLACQQGNEAEVKALLKKNPSLATAKARNGKTALHFCAEVGSFSCLDPLLSKVVEGSSSVLLNSQDEEGYTPLHLAVINGHKDVVRRLIGAGADVNCVDNESHSLVHWATVCGEVDLLEYLLSAGAPASTPDFHQAHPIHYAAQMCGSVDGSSSVSRARVQSTVYGVSPKKGMQILKRLIQAGVHIDVRDQDGRQPLLWAASAGIHFFRRGYERRRHVHRAIKFVGSGDAILLLVNAGAKVDAEDRDGLTALHCAASRGHTDCLETLIGLCGAEVDVIDNNGCSALFYAVTLGHADSTQLLLNYGAEPNRQDRKGRTPAHCGASKGQLETLKLLSKHDGNLWLRNVRGDLPLHEAILSRRKDLVVWLLSQRPDTVNTPNNDARTPVHLAALSNNVEMVKILIDYRADINLLMRSGKGSPMTPLDAAIHKGNSAVAKFLQLHGGLPSNSLNDAALLRRMNRSMLEGTISPAHSQIGGLATRSVPGSQLGFGGGGGVIGGVDNDVRNRTFVSPDLFDNTMSFSRASNVNGELQEHEQHILSSQQQQGTGMMLPSPLASSTPIMDDGVQTDPGQFRREMEVQVSSASLDAEEEEEEETKTDADADAGGATEDKPTEETSESVTASSQTTPSNSPPEDKESPPVEGQDETQPSEEPSPSPEKGDESPNHETNDEPDVQAAPLKPASPRPSSSSHVEEKKPVSRPPSSRPPSAKSRPHSRTNSAKRLTLEQVETPVEEEDGGPSNLPPPAPSPVRVTWEDEHEESLLVRKDSAKRPPSTSTSPRPGSSRNSNRNKKETSRPSSSRVKESPGRRRRRQQEVGEQYVGWDEIEFGRYIDLQDAARRRSESLVKNGSFIPSPHNFKQHTCDPINKPPPPSSKTIKVIRRKQVVMTKTRRSTQPRATKPPTTSEEREIQLQEALLASSSKLRPPQSRNINSNKPSPNKRNLNKSDGSRKSSEEHLSNSTTTSTTTGGKSAAFDSGFLSEEIHHHSRRTTRTIHKLAPPNGNGKTVVGRVSLSPQKKSSETTKDQEDEGSLSPRRTSRERKSIFSSSPKYYRAPHAGSETFNLSILHGQSNGHGTNSTSTTRGGSVTSEEGTVLSPPMVRRRRNFNFRPRSRLTFSRNQEYYMNQDFLNSSPKPKKETDVETPISVTQAMQASMRKYNLERMIFHELLELKRLQLRAGKANETLVVRRLAENYKRAGFSVNFRDFEGPFTFRNFEKYLYDQLRLLQNNRKVLPRFAPSDDIDKLTTALKKMNSAKLPYLEDAERSESVCDNITCTHTTHRCHHAAHAYTGVPCAAYIGTRKNVFLPKVNPTKAPGPIHKEAQSPKKSSTGSKNPNSMQISITPRRTDTASPITLEVQQGANTQVFNLPTKTLDPSKNYYVSLSIQPNSTSTSPNKKGKQETKQKKDQVPKSSYSSLSRRSPAAGDIGNDGSISAPPPPVDLDPDNDPALLLINTAGVDDNRERYNLSM